MRILRVGFVFILVSLFFSLNSREIYASSLIPEITNDNPNAKVYFWLKKTDGTTEIIMIAPHTKKALPVNTVEIQYLYMEGKDIASFLPELSTLQLTAPPFSMEEEESHFFMKEEAHQIDALYSREIEAGQRLAPRIRSSRRNGKFKRFFEKNW